MLPQLPPVTPLVTGSDFLRPLPTYIDTTAAQQVLIAGDAMVRQMAHQNAVSSPDVLRTGASRYRDR